MLEDDYVPEISEDYDLPDPYIPYSMPELPEKAVAAIFHKDKFAEYAFSEGLTQAEARTEWDTYSKVLIGLYSKMHQKARWKKANENKT